MTLYGIRDKKSKLLLSWTYYDRKTSKGYDTPFVFELAKFGGWALRSWLTP